MDSMHRSYHFQNFKTYSFGFINKFLLKYKN